ncbi:MAG TPA: aldo/keto reductase [Clostridia bacterium]|nr:aldo/keto reductase [Clostridia bacterium]
MEKRPFGKTGVELPILSLGCQRLVNEEGCDQDHAVAIIERALQRGISYFDTAPAYSEGESERRVGLVAMSRRMDMWIATKVNETTRDGARRQLEASLGRLQTDHVEEVRLHNVFSFDRLDAMTGKGGALHALTEARDEGLVRFISISGHANPQVLVEAIRRFPFDTALCAVSALDHFIYSFAEEFLPFALQKCMGVVGMKVLGFKALAEDWKRALRYSMALPVTTVITGCSTIEQLDGNIDVAESFVPMTSVERLAFFRDILPLVTPQNMPWKSKEWARKEWIERKEPFGLTRSGCQ